ncbi:MAG: hypothetical protein ABJP33_16150 [Pseudoruegeria sp.]
MILKLMRLLGFSFEALRKEHKYDDDLLEIRLLKTGLIDNGLYIVGSIFLVWAALHFDLQKPLKALMGISASFWALTSVLEIQRIRKRLASLNAKISK